MGVERREEGGGKLGRSSNLWATVEESDAGLRPQGLNFLALPACSPAGCSHIPLQVPGKVSVVESREYPVLGSQSPSTGSPRLHLNSRLE